MSDLKKGSTIGGFEIITESNKSLHTHDYTQLTGYGNAALLDDGPGQDINVDGLDTYHFSDMENNFVNIVGDTINGDLIIDIIDTNNPDSGVSTTFTNNYFYHNNAMVLEYNPYVNIDEDTFQISQISNTEIETTSSYAFINGDEYNLSSYILDINSLGNNPNSTIYVYIEYDSSGDNVFLDLDSQYFQNSIHQLIIAEIETDSSGNIGSIWSYTPYRWLNSYTIVNDSLPHGITLTDSQGIIDESWLLYKPSLTENISLDGPREVSMSGTITYTITDYDAFSTYSATISDGSVSITNDVITVTIPQLSENRDITLSITKDGNTIDFNISYISEQYLSGDIDEIWKKTLQNNGPEDLMYGDMVIDKETNTLYLTGIHNTGSQYRFKIFKYNIYNEAWTQLIDEAPQGTYYSAYSKITIIGDYVYVIGGSNDFDTGQSNNGLEASNIMFRINRFNDVFQSLNNIPINVIYHDITTDGIGRIYLVGGMESIASNTYNNYVYEYSVDNNLWSQHPEPIPFEDTLKGHICEYHKGRIYIHGLTNTQRDNMVWKYNVIRREWNVLNNETNINKLYHNSSKYDNKIYIFGGADSNGDYDHVFYEYYPELGSYLQIASYPDYFEYANEYDYPLATDNYGFLYIYDYKENSLWRMV